ncbi:23S rRNA (adenine(2030)-N(6))-methyltransferase RlmJ [Salinispirillum sp. LH 10-3-1]|uniref:Ribosomal RNA large subunit methyltransferase J n=1 Tax=Salinispirillum sp. LH 10-3-1 TaxID=2952525 RepID=A0AB38YBW5_9GAMM
MLSYRHSFHAGNFADVLKHTVLMYVLNYMNRKDKPYCYIDTHAGAGMYRLDSPEANKTGEFMTGIGLLHDIPLQGLLADYTALIRVFNNNSNQLNNYPGSPAIAQHYLRDHDRAQLTELHSSDFKLLSDYIGRQRAIGVLQKDGLEHLIATLPPREKRALVLIDPSYEIKTDYAQVAKTLAAAVQRFSTGTYMIWYPVIKRADTESFISALVKTGIPDMLRLELCVKPDDLERGMTGSGMILVNPPYSLKQEMEGLMPELHQRLVKDAEHRAAPWQVTQLSAEK